MAVCLFAFFAFHLFWFLALSLVCWVKKVISVISLVVSPVSRHRHQHCRDLCHWITHTHSHTNRILFFSLSSDSESIDGIDLLVTIITTTTTTTEHHASFEVSLWEKSDWMFSLSCKCSQMINSRWCCPEMHTHTGWTSKDAESREKSGDELEEGNNGIRIGEARAKIKLIN